MKRIIALLVLLVVLCGCTVGEKEDILTPAHGLVFKALGGIYVYWFTFQGKTYLVNFEGGILEVTE